MRPTACLYGVFALICVLALCRTETSQGSSAAVTPKEGNTAASVKKTWQVWDWGPDQKQAVESALKKATAKVHDYLRVQEPPFEWFPSTEYVKNNLVKKGDPERLTEKDFDPKFNGKEEKLQCWAVTVEITQGDFDSMRRESDLVILAHKQRDRLSLFAKLVGVLVAGCVLTVLYLRLEEKTKGYFSRLLLVGAVAALVVIGAGLFLFV